MSELAALGTVPEEAPGKSLRALSGPLPRPHKPLLRHSQSPFEPETGDSQQIVAGSRGQIRFTSCRNKPNTFEENKPMAEVTTLEALASETDDDLLVRYQQLDDQAAYAELDRRYRDKLVGRVCQWRGGVLRSQAEDIVQESLLSFHTNRKRYAPKCVRALLHKIVGDHCKDRVEKAEAKKRDHRITRRLLETDADPKADPAKQQSEIEANDILSTLIPEEADALWLKIEGHSAESAGRLRNVPARTMRHRVERGINAFKELAAPVLIVLAVVGAVANDCDADVYLDLCAIETDEDEIFREDSGHHESNKLCRKSLMRLPIWPDAAEVDPNMTHVVNARHEDYDVLIARPSKWGNPFQIGRDGDRERVIRMYEVHVRRRPDLLAALPELAGACQPV